jgi:hypothetical protein
VLLKSLQSSSLNIETALNLAEITIHQLKEMNNNKKVCDDLIDTIFTFSDKNMIERSSISNQRRRSSHSNQQAKRSRIDIDPLQKSLDQYIDIIDVFINHISEKFNTDSYKPLIAISTLLTSYKKPELSEIFFDLIIYRDDFNIDKIDIELNTWYDFKAKNKLNTIEEIRKFQRENLKIVFTNIFILLSIYLTVPITSSEAERSFSCLKRLKTWLRTTIGQIRLSSLAIIYMNAPKLKNLDINLFA